MASHLTTGVTTSIPLIASGGTPPYTYSILSGSIPGLTLNTSTGILSGTPTTANSYTISWRVTDSTLATADDSFDVLVKSPAAIDLTPHYVFKLLSGLRFGLRVGSVVGVPNTITAGIRFALRTGKLIPQKAALTFGGVSGFAATTRNIAKTDLVLGGVGGVTATTREFIGANLVAGGVGGFAMTTRQIQRADLVLGGVGGFVLSAFQPETNILLAAFTGTYDAARQDAIDALIKALKDAGVWAKLDVLRIAGLNSSDTLINWKSPGTFNSSLVSSPTFVTDRGFSSSSGNYINTNFAPSTAGGNYALNSSHAGFYSRTNSTGTRYELGVSQSSLGSASSMGARFADGNSYSRLSTGPEQAHAVPSSQGFFLASRTSSTLTTVYRNGSSIGTSSNTSVALNSNPFFEGTQNVNGSPQSAYSERQLTAITFGGGLSSTEASDYNTALLTYLTYIGANV